MTEQAPNPTRHTQIYPRNLHKLLSVTYFENALLPEPITDPQKITHLDIHRRDRLGGILHEYHHAA